MEAFTHVLALSAVSFVLHLLWELIQCPIFYEHGSYDATWVGMIRAALGDVGLTWAIYVGVAAASLRWRWADRPWSWLQIAALTGLSVALAIAVELRALDVGSWSYTEVAPRLPLLGVSAVPIMQLAMLTPVIIALSEWLVRRVSSDADPERQTEFARRRYDRIAPIYDALEWFMELRARQWRAELWSLVEGRRVLELGVGTGKNLPFYPPNANVTAIDISQRMIERARRRAEQRGVTALIEHGDAQRLTYEDSSFDVVVATFVFCSVPDPGRGLREVQRVLRPGGQLLLLEHVLSNKPMLRLIMRLLDPVSFHLWGAHIARETVEAVTEAGFVEITVTDKSLDIMKLIQAKGPRPPSEAAHIPGGSPSRPLRTGT